MRAIHRLLILVSFSSAAPAFAQADQPEPGDAASAPATEEPATQAPRGRLLGLLRAAPLNMGTSPLRLSGDIDGSDGVDDELQLKYEDFRITFQAGQRIRISAMSFNMDPRLRILAPGATAPLMDDEDSGRGANARLIFAPTQDGLYIVRVLGTNRGLNGPYRLTLEPAPPLPDAVTTEGASVAGTTRWSEFSGDLTTADLSMEGLYFEDYRLSLARGQEVFVRLDSPVFDPVVQIYAAADREGDYLVMDDDSGPGTGSMLLFRPTEAGDYVVRVTTFSNRTPTGRYTLRIGR